MATTELQLMADVKDYMAGINRVLQAQEKQIQAIKKTTAASKESDKASRDAHRAEQKALGDLAKQEEELGRKRQQMAKQAGNFAGAAGGGGVGLGGALAGGGAAGLLGAGINKALSSYIEGISNAGQASRKFQDDVTNLMSLGENYKAIPKITGDILSLSDAFGIAKSDIASAFFNIQSGGSSLSETIQKDILQNAIELTKVTGTDLQGSSQSLLKTWLIYGDTLRDVNDAQNKLANAADRAQLTFGDLSERVADVLAPAKAMKYSLDDILASLVVATAKGGKTEATFTGLKNVILKMNDAMEKGYVTSGSFSQQLQQLSKLDTQTLVGLVGNEGAVVASNLTSGANQVASESAISKGLTGDITKSKMSGRFMTDPAYRNAELQKIIEQQGESDQIRQFGGISKGGVDPATEQKLLEAYDQQRFGVGNDWIGTGSRYLRRFQRGVDAMTGQTSRSSITENALDSTLTAMTNGGRGREADALSVQFGLGQDVGLNASRAAKSAQAYFRNNPGASPSETIASGQSTGYDARVRALYAKGGPTIDDKGWEGDTAYTKKNYQAVRPDQKPTSDLENEAAGNILEMFNKLITKIVQDQMLGNGPNQQDLMRANQAGNFLMKDMAPGQQAGSQVAQAMIYINQGTLYPSNQGYNQWSMQNAQYAMPGF